MLTSGQSVLGNRMPAIWHIFIPTSHYQKLGICLFDRSATHCEHSVHNHRSRRLLTIFKVPIYITAAVVAIVVAWFSDRHGQRSPFIFVSMGCIAAGFIICLAASGKDVPGVVYFGVFVAALGMLNYPYEST